MKTILASPHSYGGTRSLLAIKYIVIHYTAGKGDTAENEGLYFKNVNKRAAGAHFFVGYDGTIVKSIELNRIAWAVGGAKYTDCPQTGGGKYYGKCTNANSVSIELCDNLTKDPSPRQIEGVKECIQYIRKSCPAAHTIIRHFDVTGKHCPARMMDAKRWDRFRQAIGEIKNPAEVSLSTGEFKVKILAKSLNVRETPNADSVIVTSVRKNEVYTITLTCGSWGKLKSGAGWINCSEKYVKRM